MTTETLLLLIIVVFLAATFPTWPYNKSWGYGPTGVLAILLAVFLIWAIAGGRPLFRSSLEDVGHDIKSAGRDVADSVRGAVQ
ncbi:MAG: DUF3309 domain-containing protein [Candidatus Omnitrophota bacterium]